MNSHARWLLSFSAALLVSACGQGSMFECAPARDWGVESMGLTAPSPLPFDTAKLDVIAIAPLYSKGAPVIAALVGARYADVQAYFDRVAARSGLAQQYGAIADVTRAIDRRGLYLLPSALAWAQASPDSKAAKFVLGEVYTAAASEAHGGGYAREISQAQMDIFRQRLAHAAAWLEPLAKDDDALGLSARYTLSGGYFLTGRSQEGWQTHRWMIEKLPALESLYVNALEYAHPKWSGNQSEERAAQVLNLAEKNGLPLQNQKLLAQIVQAFRDDIENNADPKAWRTYWTQRTAEVPGKFNLTAWLVKEAEVQNWVVVEALAEKIIDLNPGDRYAWHQKAWALQQLGKNDEAFSAMVSAAVVGNDGAMSSIVYAYVKGTLGRRQQAIEAMYEYCKFGAALGLPSAANCMASSYTDGFGGVKRDDLQAVRWHLLAARGGEINSMHDLGVLLPRVVTGSDAQLAAQFWMRKAAEGGHSFALKKLDGQSAPRPSLGCRVGSKPAELVDLVRRFYSFSHNL